MLQKTCLPNHGSYCREPEILRSHPVDRIDFFPNVTGLQSQIWDLRSEISDRRSQIWDLRSEISDRRSQILDLRSQISDLWTWISYAKRRKVLGGAVTYAYVRVRTRTYAYVCVRTYAYVDGRETSTFLRRRRSVQFLRALSRPQK